MNIIDGHLPTMMTPKGIEAMIDLGADEQFRYENTFAYISAYRMFFGSSPSVRDIAEAMQITVSAAQRRVLVLINRGWLVKTQRKARTIRPASISFHGDQLEIMDLYRQKWIRHISGTTKTYAPDQSSW